MDKKLLIVLPLCFAIVIGWSLISHRMGWSKDPERPLAPVAAPAQPGRTGDVPAQAARPEREELALPVVGPVVQDDAERSETLTVGTRGRPGRYQATFTNRGAALTELRTGNYFDRAGRSAAEQQDPAHWQVLVGDKHSAEQSDAFALRATLSSQPLVREPLERALWRMRRLTSEDKAEGVEFELAPGTGVTFVKRFRFVPDSDQIALDLEIRNDAVQDTSGFRNFVLTPAAGVPNDSGDAFYSEPQALAPSHAPEGRDVDLDPEFPHPNGDPRSGLLPSSPPLVFAGLQNKYFAVLLRAADDETRPALSGASWRGLRDEPWLARNPGSEAEAWRQLEVDVDLQLALPPAGGTRAWRFLTYAGPKQSDALVAAFPAHAALVKEDLGFTSGIAELLLGILGFFHWVTLSWGLSIVLLTVLVRTLLFPVNRRSQTAMARYAAKMKRLQPRIDELKKKYASDPRKLREEQTRLMQQEGAFPPLGGCLPPLLQIPIFIGLFRAIGVSFDLRQESFLGIVSDLSLPDRLIPFDVTLPYLGHVTAINVLPPLMVGLWIWQQRLMPMPTDEQQRTMYKMMLWMPVVMGIFLYNYAAGLSLYMITSSGLAIVEQKFIKKHWPIDDRELPKKKSAGFLARMMAEQAKRMKVLEPQKRAKARR